MHTAWRVHNAVVLVRHQRTADVRELRRLRYDSVNAYHHRGARIRSEERDSVEVSALV